MKTSRRPICVISIVNHSHDRKIQELLASFDMYLEPGEYDVRIVVRENIQTRPGTKYSSRFPLRQVKNDAPKGFGTNHNLNFAIEPCDLFLVVNPDLVLMGACRLADTKALPEEFLASPVIYELDGTIADFRRAYPTPKTILQRRLLGITNVPTQGARFWLAGVFLLVPSSVFQMLGGFDEAYYMYVEDCDLSWRAARSGVSLEVLGDWHVRHEAQRASRRSRQHLLWHLRSLMRFWRKLTLSKIGF